MKPSIPLWLACISFLSAAPALTQILQPVDSFTDTSVSRWDHSFGRGFWFDADRSPTNFRWRTSSPRSFEQNSDGTARLRGTIQNVKNSNHRLTVDISLSGYVPPGSTPPSGSPKLSGLKSSALRDNGGPVDPDGWAFYREFKGTLTGTDGLAGWVLAIERTGPAFQLGFGASMENADFGMSSWFEIKFKSRGGNWDVKDRGDINSGLDFDPNTCVSLHSFKGGSNNSTGSLPCTKTHPAEFGRPVRVNPSDGYIVLRDEDWSPATTRSQSVAENAYVQLRFSPDAGKQVSLTQLCVDLARNEYAITRTIDIRYDEDPGTGGDNFTTVLKSLMLPDEDGGVRAFRRFCFDLNVPELTNLTKETRIRLYFWGESRRSTRNDTYLDGLCLGGMADCIKAQKRDLGPGDCTPFVSLAIDQPPAIGTTPKLTIRGNIPGAPIILMFTLGCGDGQLRIPGTTCRIWLDVSRKIRLLTKTQLSASGHVDILLPITQAYSPAVGIEFGLQAILWDATGDGVSNGMCISVGCK